eukprot:1182268-Prorocentrum_minimum.AAC.4
MHLRGVCAHQKGIRHAPGRGQGHERAAGSSTDRTPSQGGGPNPLEAKQRLSASVFDTSAAAAAAAAAAATATATATTTTTARSPGLGVCGQVCETGDVGFCPEPHLHMQMHTSRAPEAPTIKFALTAADGSSYFPEANKYYDAAGLAT